MNIVEQTMRMQIEIAYGERKWVQNPLIAIGLTQAILDLNLTDDQLFRAVRSYVRQLAMAVHPDRPAANQTPGFDEKRTSKVMLAFGQLDDEALFLKALKEFRNLHAEDRHEINLIRQDLDALQEQYDTLVANVGSAGEIRATLATERVALEAERTRIALRAPSAVEGLDVAEKKIRSLEKEVRESGEKILRLTGLLSGARSYLMFQRFLFDGGKSLKTAAEIRELAVLHFSFSIDKKEKTKASEIERFPSNVREACWAHVKLLGGMIPEWEKESLFLHFRATTFRVLHGCIEDRGHERMLGSLPLENIQALNPIASQCPPPDLVLRYLRPQLVIGSLLVTTDRRKFKAEAQEHHFLDTLPTTWNKHSFRGGRIILAIR